MTGLEGVSCNLCGKNDAVLVYATQGSARFSFPGVLNYVKCKGCGLVYTSPRPNKQITEQQYEEKYHRTDLPLDTKDYLRKILLNSLGRLKFVEKYKRNHDCEFESECYGRSLLDVGCCQGNFIDIARLKGWQVQGIEVSKRYSKVGVEQFKLPIFCGVLEEAIQHDDFGDFDVITSFDVIEHLRDPLGFLQLCKQLLAQNGVLIAETCNYDSLHQLVLGKKWQNDAGQHLYLFTPRTLKELALKAGFSSAEVVHRTGWENIFAGEAGEGFFSYTKSLVFRMLSKLLHKESMIVLVAKK